MIDINNIVNTAIQNEVHKTITTYVDAYMANVQQEHREQIAALKAEIEQLKQQPAPTTSTTTTTTPVTPELAQDLLRLLKSTNSPDIRHVVFEIAHEAAESVLADHLEAYDHDEYDRAVRFIDEDLPSDFPDFDDFVKHDDLGDAIEEKLNDLVDMDEFAKTEDLPDFDDFVKTEDLPDFDDLITNDDMTDAVREAVRDTLENSLVVSLHLS